MKRNGRHAGAHDISLAGYPRFPREMNTDIIKAACDAWLAKREQGFKAHPWRPINFRKPNQ